ncbi:hypothetical protein B0A58_01815 [Flavobacterium branchiophilum NBRC 15030 = ATCC 35035]|uniref:RHS repeat-associated protein n=1 Tax=Flavobacterium branchiophilum TaxID=55197 RepID=A0A543G3B8_9FLAO|nr:RHS repeat-associated core domain-containing protein [Flavobacterium branchiophilum]OXA81016.1 hypothetical protein B0A58_01815 [Flavobacterium branchiophilum NBRC 15030 = ATCC 35035]TQM40571.1 RHS repeat-associated protein [Flavobacterium branchiophilum]GEM56634.1 hypothetical protein FB1_28550 [Flavobacterium branchiophilum NBRC 15030 = ATCC 35035]
MAQQLGNNYYNSPYKFNGKELDDETGFYYYGARYYDPRVSIWMSVDPLAEKFPSLSPYNYCLNNPVNLIDTDGRKPIPIQKLLNIINGVAKLKTFERAWKNSGHGNNTVEEWGFTISTSSDKKWHIGRNLHTDHKDGSVSRNSNIPSTEKLAGYAHTHPYNKGDGAPLGAGFSPSDISNLRSNSSQGGFFTMVEAGNKRYAAVISDPELATQFFKNNSKGDIQNKMDSILIDPKNSSLSFQERIDKALTGTFGDGSKSGITIFNTNDKKKENFKPLKE